MERSHLESAPIWREGAPLVAIHHVPALHTEVCVIGAGIAGLTTAYLLRQAGHDVEVIDAYSPGAGETGRTTAHLTAVLDDRFVQLERFFGADGARAAAASHAAAIDLIERIVRDESIECDFERLDGYLVSTRPEQDGTLREEAAAASRAGFDDLQAIDSLQLPRVSLSGPAIRFPRQATFHAGRYLRGLAKAFAAAGGRIVSSTRAIDVHGGASARVDLDSGAQVAAQYVVVATNTPFNDRVAMHTKQHAYRTYVVGLRIPRHSFSPFLLWDLEDPYHYVRIVRGELSDTLIVGGEDHKTGQEVDPLTRYRKLEQWARANFANLGEVTHRWSGQVMEPVDGLAYIGRNPLDDDNVFIVTGDSGNGMTHGSLAGLILSDLIEGRENPWAALYAPNRKTLRAAGTYIGENANFVNHLVKDWASGGEVASRDEIPHGSGAIVRDGVAPIAAFRDATGELHEVSAVCTHLGCVVQWNTAESSWDCPCHGSRFAPDGAVLNGPAAYPLKSLDGPDREKVVAEPTRPSV
jgi:glycine/D-amino acid oxidase-like deaminating enzyme/nitrite reductase/ring-hydroxylating ferredoxin subunit